MAASKTKQIAATVEKEIAATVENDIEEEFGPKLIGKLEVRFFTTNKKKIQKFNKKKNISGNQRNYSWRYKKISGSWLQYN